MYVEYGTACATSASGVYNSGGGVRGVRKSGVRISPLPVAADVVAAVFDALASKIKTKAVF